MGLRLLPPVRSPARSARGSRPGSHSTTTGKSEAFVLVRTLWCGVLLAAVSAAPAAAQQTSQPTSSEDTRETRPALPTFHGDTGFWLVPTAETLRPRGWSFSLYRANFDERQGLTDISQVGITGAFGISDRFELFGSW